MDTHSSHPDDLKKLEARLANWKPAPEGLDPEAMLFAAGRASAPVGKAWLAWPVACGCLVLTVVALGVRLSAERSERLALLREIQRMSSETGLAASSYGETAATTLPGPDSYLVLRREWEHQAGDWSIRPVTPVKANAAPVEQAILRAWQPGGPPEPL